MALGALKWYLRFYYLKEMEKMGYTDTRNRNHNQGES